MKSFHDEERAQTLMDALGEISPQHLAEALQAETPAALAALQPKDARPQILRRRIGRRGLIACASIALALCVGMGALLPLLRDAGQPPIISDGSQLPQPVPPEWVGDMPDAVDSLDKVNYYAGMYLITRMHTEAARFPSPGVVLLAETTSDDDRPGVGYDAPPDADRPADAPVVVPPDGGQQDPDKETIPPLTGYDDVIYYSLDPNERFTVSSVIYFCIELTDETGFLASRLGTGVVEVVITDNSLEPMITFRRGERFYSCLNNGGGSGMMDFSTHKYIEGFNIVKNLAQENYRFDITFGEASVLAMRCSRNEAMPSHPQCVPDDIVLLPNDSVWQTVSGSFTVAELDEMASKQPLPDQDETHEEELLPNGESDNNE